MSRQYNINGSYILVVCPNPSVDILASIKKLKEGEVNRIMEEKHFPGGKGVHVAMAASELGEKIILLGFWAGPSGAWIRKEVEKSFNIRCVGPEVDGWSRSCFTFKSNEGFNETELLGVGPVITEQGQEEFMKAYDTYIGDAKCVCMSGSWPLNAPADGYARLTARAQLFSKAVFVDCTGSQFNNALKFHPALVHLNRSEATTLFSTSDVKDAAIKLSRETDYAAVTDGAKGLYLVSEQVMVHAFCKVSKVYSTVGSGDCLTAGLAFGFVRNFDMKNMAKIGVACGAANCIREELGLIYRQDVERLFREAEVSEVLIDYSN